MPPRPAPTSRSPSSTATPANSSPTATAHHRHRLGGQTLHRRRPAAAGVQGPDPALPRRPQMLDVMLRSSDDSAAEIFWNRSGGSAIINRVVARYGLGSTRTTQRAVVQHHQHGDRSGALLRHDDGRAPAACRPSRPASSCPTWRNPPTDGMVPGGVTRSDSASRRVCSPNRSRSNRAGCAASARTGCICPPASSARIAATSWPSARCSRPAPPTPADDHPGGQDDVPRRARSSRSVQQFRARSAGALQCLLRRQAAILAWSPDSSTGHVQPAPARRPGVAGTFQQAVRVRIILV